MKILKLTYTELGLGYARPINERLTVEEIQNSFGAGNLKLRVNEIQVRSSINGDPRCTLHLVKQHRFHSC